MTGWIVMPFSYDIDSAQNLVRVELFGCADDAEALEAIQSFIADPRFRPGMRILCDRSAPSVPSTGFVDKLMRLLKTNADRLGAAKWAIVVYKVATFGMGRMTEMKSDYLGIVEMRVFTELAEAERWLIEADGEGARADSTATA